MGDTVFIGGDILNAAIGHGHPEYSTRQRIAGFRVHLPNGQAGFFAVGQHNGSRFSRNQFHIVNRIVQNVSFRAADFLHLIPIFLQIFKQSRSVLAGGNFGVFAAAAPRNPDDRAFQGFAGIHIDFPDQQFGFGKVPENNLLAVLKAEVDGLFAVFPVQQVPFRRLDFFNNICSFRQVFDNHHAVRVAQVFAHQLAVRMGHGKYRASQGFAGFGVHLADNEARFYLVWNGDSHHLIFL